MPVRKRTLLSSENCVGRDILRIIAPRLETEIYGSGKDRGDR